MRKRTTTDAKARAFVHFMAFLYEQREEYQQQRMNADFKPDIDRLTDRLFAIDKYLGVANHILDNEIDKEEAGEVSGGNVVVDMEAG